jgi:hypothetical protein
MCAIGATGVPEQRNRNESDALAVAQKDSCVTETRLQ